MSNCRCPTRPFYTLIEKPPPCSLSFVNIITISFCFLARCHLYPFHVHPVSPSLPLLDTSFQGATHVSVCALTTVHRTPCNFRKDLFVLRNSVSQTLKRNQQDPGHCSFLLLPSDNEIIFPSTVIEQLSYSTTQSLIHKFALALSTTFVFPQRSLFDVRHCILVLVQPVTLAFSSRWVPFRLSGTQCLILRLLTVGIVTGRSLTEIP